MANSLNKIDDRGLTTPIDLLDNEKIRLGTGNDLELYHDGASRITHTGAGNLIISTTATDSDLYLRGKDKVVIQPADGEDGVICNANGSVELYYDNSKKFEISSTGISVTGSGVATGNSAKWETVESGGATVRMASGGSLGYVGTYSNHDLLLLTNSTERLRIDSSGRLLIGTTTEGEASADNLTVAGSGHEGITIRSGTSHFGSLFFSDGTSGTDEYKGAVEYNHNGDYLYLRTAATERVRIDSSGNVTIKDAKQLLFENDAQDANSAILNLGASGTSNLAFAAGGAERMRIDGSGKVGIGCTPSKILDVEAAAGGNYIAHFRNGTSATPYTLQIEEPNSPAAGYPLLNVTNNGASTEWFRVDSARGVTQLKMHSGAGIDFSATSNAGGMTSELLDSYEEGTFTPTFNFSGGTGTFTCDAQIGRYTKIGDRVLYTMIIRSTGHSGTTTGNLRVAGLPYAVKDDSPCGGSAFFVTGGNFTTNYGMALQLNTAEQIEFYGQVQSTGNNYDSPTTSTVNKANLFIKVEGTYYTEG